MFFRGRALQYYIFGTANFISILCGLHFGWPSPSLPQLLSNNSTIPLTNDEGSWVASIFLIGGICGAILMILVLDIIGRQKLLVITCLPLFGTWLMIAFARTTVELYVARFLAGISDGLSFCCLPVYLAEISDPNIRGLFMSGASVAYLFGSFLMNVIGSFFDIATVAFAASALSLVAIALSLLIPESPQFFLIKEDIARARLTLQKLKADDNVEELLNLIMAALKKQKHNLRSSLELFTGAENRRSLCLVLLLRVIQNLSGSVGIMFYIQTLFKEAEKDVNPIVFISIYYLLQMTASMVNAVTIDRVGRRPLIITSMSVVIVALSIVSAYFTIQNETQIDLQSHSWLAIFGFFLFIIGYTMGLHNISIILAGELFPMNVKAWAVGILDICYGATATAVSKFFQYTKDEYGMHVPFIVFAISIICGLPFVILCVPETKGKTLEEIQSVLKPRKKSKGGSK